MAEGAFEGRQVVTPSGRSGRLVEPWMWAVVVLAGAALVVGVVGVIRSLVRRDRARHRQARRDPLTGLGNRFELTEAAETMLSDPELEDGDGGRGPALLLVDLDGFKDVNDILGHAAGDVVLVQVARQMQTTAGPGALVTRLGGDEFAVLLDGRHTPVQAVMEAKKLLAGFGGGDFSAQGVSLDIRASIGVALAPQHGRHLPELLRHADVAMYEAKRRREGVVVYDPALDPAGGDRLGTLALIRGAMDDGELHLRYQPLVEARTEKVIGFEALLRWDHPTRGLLLPAEFVPLIECTALIHPLTRWVLLTATNQAAEWRARGLDVTIAVNISPVTLEDGLIGIVEEALALSRLPARCLVLEITESAITLDPLAAARVVRRLRARGVQVSIDDFGAGFTSLGLLGGLPVHQLKIDRQFTEGLGTTSHDAIVSSIIELGHRLGLVVVAEGVESARAARQLVDLGCDELQGFYFARPLTAADVPSWYADHVVSGPKDVSAGSPAGPVVAPVAVVAPYLDPPG